MLSPGKYHLQIPKEPLANLEFRVAILKAAAKDPRIQRGLMAMCKQDCLFFINLFCIQINPKLREKGPFITWPYQDVAILGGKTNLGGEDREQYGLLECVEDQKDIRWPKSREGGASWVVLLVIVWLCLFHDNILAGAISRDEDSVDKIDDPSSLFEKVRIILRHLPDWMKGKVKSKKMGIVFENGNILTGEANVGSSGVGSRFTIMLVDEFGQFDKNGEAIYNFTSDTCDCRVFVGTHKDNAGMFYLLCYDAKFARMREIVTHWSQHPMKRKGLYRHNEETNHTEILDTSFDYSRLKDFKFVLEAKPTGGPCPGIRSPWYDDECIRRTDRDIAMNLDIDPRGASDRFFDAYRINVLKHEHAREPMWQGNLIHDKDGKPLRLEEAHDGLLKLWINPKSETELPLMRAGAAVDVSAGTGSSPSCLSIGNARTGEKVAEYSNAAIYAQDFARFVVAFLRMIRDENGIHPLLAWEIQGSAVFAKIVLEELHYGPVYWRRDEDAMGKPRDNKGRAGWNPTPKGILTLMEEYRDALYQQRCINRSESALDETLNFVYTTNSVEYRAKGKRQVDGSGATIHHGDVVRSDALMFKMIQGMGFESPEKERQKIVWDMDPRTSAGREKLDAYRRIEEEQEVWA